MYYTAIESTERRGVLPFARSMDSIPRIDVDLLTGTIDAIVFVDEMNMSGLLDYYDYYFSIKDAIARLFKILVEHYHSVQHDVEIVFLWPRVKSR